MPYSLHAALAVLGLTLVAARPAEMVSPVPLVRMVVTGDTTETARPCGRCSDYPDEVEIYLHYFPNGAEEGRFLEMVDVSGPMGGPNAAMSAATPWMYFDPDLFFCDALDPVWQVVGACSSADGHDSCDAAAVTDLDLIEATAKDGISSADWKAFEKYGSSIRVAMASQYLDVLGCGGRTVARIPIGSRG
jgi:hypothetical protein